MQMIREHISLEPEVAITYFVPDTQKEGGSYLQVIGVIKKLDDIEHKILMKNGTVIPINDIYEVESTIFNVID